MASSSAAAASAKATPLTAPQESQTPALPQLEAVDEDDEFEDFREESWGAEAKAKEEDLVEWAADWDDDTVETDFDVALKKELAAFREGAAATAAATAAAAVNVDTEVK